MTGSLFLSSFSCRLKPGPSGERGRKSSRLLQDMLITGLGPTSVRVDGRVQAWTRLALDSFKGSNPVWKATGHNEPVDGRVRTWTRHGRAIIPKTDGATTQGPIGHFQPTRMGDPFFSAVFQCGIQVVGFTAVRSGIVSLSFLLSWLGRAGLSGLRFVHFYLFLGPEAFAYLVYLGVHMVSIRPTLRKVYSFLDSDGLIVFRKACRFLKAPQPTQRGRQPEDWQGQSAHQREILKRRKISRGIVRGSDFRNDRSHLHKLPLHCNSTALRVVMVLCV